MADRKNLLFYGDNLDVLREHIGEASVDLIYLDPPFNSNRSYNVLFKSKSGDEAQAQIEAFDDTWTWSQQSEATYSELVQGGAPLKVADALEAMRRLLGDNDVLAYLVMMTARLSELHRVLKPTGSLYLHCDPTASHYLKLLLDAVFGPTAFANEIIWKRSHAHNSAGRFGRNHDVILFYRRSSKATWNATHQGYDEAYIAKHYRHVDPIQVAGTSTRTRQAQASAGVSPDSLGEALTPRRRGATGRARPPSWRSLMQPVASTGRINPEHGHISSSIWMKWRVRVPRTFGRTSTQLTWSRVNGSATRLRSQSPCLNGSSWQVAMRRTLYLIRSAVVGPPSTRLRSSGGSGSASTSPTWPST